MSHESSSQTFAELWRATLNSHRRIERWRAIKFRSAVVGVAALLGLVGYGVTRPEPARPPTLAAVPPDPPAVRPLAAAVPVDALRTPATDIPGPELSRVPPVPVILDTDVVNGIDDTLALAMLHGYQERAMVDLLAVTVNHRDPHVGPYVDAIDTWFGYGDTPIGVIATNSVTGGRDAFHRQVGVDRARFGHDLSSSDQVEEAVALLRRRLADQADRSVVIVATGYSTNLARLLESPADAVSPLTGQQLVAAKVKMLAVTAGDFLRAKPEHNTAKDPASARLVFDRWPTPIVASEWQLGADLPFPGAALADSPDAEDNPVVAAAVLNGRNALIVEFPYDPPSFDLTTVLYAVEPDEYFSVSDPGRIDIDDQQIARFELDAGGRHRLLQRPLDPGTRTRITNRFVELVTGPTR